MIFLKKTIIILICIFFIVAIGVYCGIVMFDTNKNNRYNNALDNNMVVKDNNIEISSLETSIAEEEKTTPNTLIIYKTYYTKCNHYVKEYKKIDASLVNYTEKELKEKCRNWNIDKFSSEEIEMSKEKEDFCGEHYKIKLENSAIVVYSIDENGIEREYQHTGITTEYLTEEDILKLTQGIYVYGKENLTSTIEDYE